MRWFALVALGGCTFTAGTRAGDAGGPSIDATDAPRDSDADIAPVNCYDRWLDGSIRFGPAVELTELDSSVYDRDPFLTDDELTVFLSSGRNNSHTIWRADRSSRSSPFGTPTQVALPFGTSDGVETKVSMTSDQLIAVVGTTRGNSQGVDVWGGARTTSADAWPTFTKVPGVNTSGNEQDPTICADGLHLYTAPDDQGSQRIKVSTRASRTDTFGTPATINILFSDTGDADPSPTPDERIILFSSNRNLNGAAKGNLWYSSRPTMAAAFSTPVNVPDVNTDEAEGDPHLSADGCRIYFAREIGDATDNWNLFVATAM